MSNSSTALIPCYGIEMGQKKGTTIDNNEIKYIVTEVNHFTHYIIGWP